MMPQVLLHLVDTAADSEYVHLVVPIASSWAASVWLTPVYTCLIPHDANSWSNQWQQTGTLEFTHWAGLCL